MPEDNTQKQIPIPPLALAPLPWPAVEILLEGLSKLPIERAGQVFFGLKDAAQKHLQAVAADAQAREAAEAAKAAPPAKMKPVAAAKKRSR